MSSVKHVLAWKCNALHRLLSEEGVGLECFLLLKLEENASDLPCHFDELTIFPCMLINTIN